MYNGQMSKMKKFVFVTAPNNYTGAAATAEWIDMSKYDRVVFVIQTGAWAGGTAAVTLLQSATNGGSSKAVAFTTMFTNDGATTTDTLTETAVTSNTFNLDTANSIYIVEVNASMLDVSSSYRWLNIAVASPGANNDYYGIVALCDNGRYLKGASSASAIA